MNAFAHPGTGSSQPSRRDRAVGSLGQRLRVALRYLVHEDPPSAYRRILVPIFQTPLDDDIVATAGRLAATGGDSDHPATLHIVHVLEVPLRLALDAPLDPEREARALAALRRAGEVAGEYEGVEVTTRLVVARETGSAIVREAELGGAEVIVMGAEPPTHIRGGATIGGSGGARPPEVGRVTEHVLGRARARVLLTAAPAAGVADVAHAGGE
ncbi:MAG: universal stress protein [Solirubrobacterales bacterium]